MLELLFLGSAAVLVVMLACVVWLVVTAAARPQPPKGSVTADPRRRSDGSLSVEYLRGLTDE